MNKENIKRLVKVFKMGFARMLVGTATAALLSLAGYVFAMIPNDSGYIAVAEFLAAMGALVLALVLLYIMGGKCKKSRTAV